MYIVISKQQQGSFMSRTVSKITLAPKVSNQRWPKTSMAVSQSAQKEIKDISKEIIFTPSAMKEVSINGCESRDLKKCHTVTDLRASPSPLRGHDYPKYGKYYRGNLCETPGDQKSEDSLISNSVKKLQNRKMSQTPRLSHYKTKSGLYNRLLKSKPSKPANLIILYRKPR